MFSKPSVSYVFSPIKLTPSSENKEQVSIAGKQHLLAPKYSQMRTRSRKEIENHLYKVYSFRRKKAVGRREAAH